ncbi:hypothetical protein V2J09_022234, partial [Rumex salicifolius]
WLLHLVGVKKSRSLNEANLFQCKLKLEDGHFTAAIKVLTSSGIASSNSATLRTSCGCDGLRAQHFVDVLGGAASTVANDFLVSVTGVVSLFLSGKCPSWLGEFIASAPLISLVKQGEDLSPRLLLDFQFGVGVLGGCEAVLHSVNRLIESKGNVVGLSVLLADFKNAFNLPLLHGFIFTMLSLLGSTVMTLSYGLVPCYSPWFCILWFIPLTVFVSLPSRPGISTMALLLEISSWLPRHLTSSRLMGRLVVCSLMWTRLNFSGLLRILEVG